MGAALIGLFALVALAVLAYAGALEWADRHNKYTASEYTVDKVIAGELICVGFPALYYWILRFFWPAYGASWTPWGAVEEVICVFIACQAIGGFIIWIWQRLKHQEFYDREL